MSVSPFYDALEGAKEYVLLYPVRSGEIVGPHWLDDGIPFAGDYDEEPILAVPLGGVRYRLAERCGGPFSCCLLRWGDEFEADAEGDTLTLRRVVMPAAYQHYFWVTSGGGLEDTALGDLLHRYGGGWEVVAGGMLTVSVPVTNLEAFESAAVALGEDVRGGRMAERRDANRCV